MEWILFQNSLLFPLFDTKSLIHTTLAINAFRLGSHGYRISTSFFASWNATILNGLAWRERLGPLQVRHEILFPSDQLRRVRPQSPQQSVIVLPPGSPHPHVHPREG